MQSESIVKETGIEEIANPKLIDSVGRIAEYDTGIADIVLNLNIEPALK